MAITLPGTPIIIDIGSAYVKIGFAGEPAPRFVFPTIYICWERCHENEGCIESKTPH